MKSFGIKRDERDPRWEKFIEWCNKQSGKSWEGGNNTLCYGLTKYEAWSYTDSYFFDRIITLDEWESEFMQPKLAGREYDESLFRDWLNFPGVVVAEENIMSNGLTKGFNNFLKQRYEKTYRISELKQQIEKLTNELKELEA